MVALELSPSTNAKQTPTQTTEDSQEEPTLSFSQLLKGLDTKVKDEKATPLMLSANNIESTEDEIVLTDDETQISKTTLLSSLLQADESTDVESLKDFSTAEIKKLVTDAKSYLKSQILESEGYKKSSVKDMPKTLKSLATLAKKFDVNLSKITLQEVQPKTVKKIEPKLSLKTNATLQKAHIQKNDLKDTVNVLKELPKEKTASLESVLKLKDTTSVNTMVSSEEKVKPKESTKLQKESKKELPVASEVQQTKKEITSKSITKPQQSTQEQSAKVQTEIQSEVKVQAQGRSEEKVQTQVLQTPQKVEVTPLGETTIQKVQVPLTQTKKTSHKKEENSSHKKVEKTKVESNFASLLKISSSVESSVDVTKVNNQNVAQNDVFKSTDGKSLESLLTNETTDNNVSTKTEVTSTQKVDSFEVKVNEAKQMMKYLSQDVKTAIDDYKSPFTKIKVQLNPQQLGEVDLTVVKRGKNLHVNISSNTAAINTLAMNVNELKMQLTSNGINNATFNFNGSQNGENAQTSQQQQQQSKEQAKQEYNYFNNEESTEEVLTSLEIVVPSYA